MRWVLLGAVALLLVVAAPAEAADACGEPDRCAPGEPKPIGPPEQPCEPMCFDTKGST